jgi:hypothetical protein
MATACQAYFCIVLNNLNNLLFGIWLVKISDNAVFIPGPIAELIVKAVIHWVKGKF